MYRDRLLQLEEILQLQYDQLVCIEKYLTNVEPSHRERIRQQKMDLLKEIRPNEEEYLQCLSRAVTSLPVPEEEVEVIVANLVQDTENISNSRMVKYPDEVIELLRKIHDTLTQPDKPAAGKLKLAIPLFLNILSYEVELDTESTLRRLFPTFTKLLKTERKKT